MAKELYVIVNGHEREEFDNEIDFYEFVGSLVECNSPITFTTIEETDKKLVVEC